MVLAAILNKKLCVSASLREVLNPFLAQSRRGAEKNLVIWIIKKWRPDP
jgi:hypothetical protein